MSSRFMARALVLVVGLVLALSIDARQHDGQQVVIESTVPTRYPNLGPEMKAYMGFIDAEEAELKHLYDVGEVPPADYRLSRDRLVVTREAALKVTRPRTDDVVPELYILLESELTQIFPSGIAAVRGKRVGTKIDDNWMYHGTIRHGELFYVLERIGGIGHEPEN